MREQLHREGWLSVYLSDLGSSVSHLAENEGARNVLPWFKIRLCTAPCLRLTR